MNLNPASLLIAVLAFAITFGMVKFLTFRKRRHKMRKEQQLARQAESRQVRRVRERRTGR